MSGGEVYAKKESGLFDSTSDLDTIGYKTC